MSDVVSLRPPKYCRHKASGQAVVCIRGRDVYLGKHGSAASKELYRRLIAEYLLTGGVTTASDPQDITVNEVLAAFIRHAKGYYRKGGKPTREYEQIVECCRLIKPLYGRAPAIEFGPLALKAVRQQMIDAGLSRRHINKQIERVRRMFKWAAAEQMIPADVPQALAMVAGLRKGRTLAPERAPVQPADDAVVDATLPHLPPVVADIVRFQRATGCRPEEACAVRPCDLDRSGEIWIYRPASHKTEHHGRDRLILVGPRAQGVLLRYLARDANEFCFRPCDSDAKRQAARAAARATPLSCGNRSGTNRVAKPKRKPGRCYSTGSYRRAIHRACEKAQLEKWSPNRLRHAAATEIRRKFGLEAAQVVLGHAKADVTQVYAERDVALATRVAREVG
ncbi:MAG: integrase [Planctomycetaceae bacterium]|nr:integrase [Planctomycetaceae bacterium]